MRIKEPDETHEISHLQMRIKGSKMMYQSVERKRRRFKLKIVILGYFGVHVT